DHIDALNVTGNFRLGYADIYPMVNQVPADTNPDRQPNYKFYKHAVYLQLQKAFFNEKLNVTLGGRFTYHKFFRDNFILRGGLVYTIKKGTNIKALFGQAFRDPVLFE